MAEGKKSRYVFLKTIILIHKYLVKGYNFSLDFIDLWFLQHLDFQSFDGNYVVSECSSNVLRGEKSLAGKILKRDFSNWQHRISVIRKRKVKYIILILVCRDHHNFEYRRSSLVLHSFVGHSGRRATAGRFFQKEEHVPNCPTKRQSSLCAGMSKICLYCQRMC